MRFLLPDSYVVFHVLTTGDDRNMDSVIEIGATKYKNGTKTEVFSMLCRPESYYLISHDRLDKIEDYCIVDGGPVQFVDQSITKRTGITNAMLYGACELDEALEKLSAFIGEELLLGYEVKEQLSWLTKDTLCNDYIELKSLAKKVWEDRRNPSLLEMAIYYEIPYGGEKRSFEFCYLTNLVYERIKESLLTQYGSEENFAKQMAPPKELLEAADYSAFDSVEGLTGKVCVFTGTLTKMVRGQAMRLVRECGGIPGSSISKKTDYLILGNKEFKERECGRKSTKLRMAERMVLNGSGLKIISEESFYQMVVEAKGRG